MDDEKLILLVQANECLYNKNCIGFKLAEKKRGVWRQIANEMQVPEEMVVKRWACLRDRYSREKRQENLPSGSGFQTRSHWPLMNAMEFVERFIIPRASRCSYNICEQFNSSPPSPSLQSSLVTSPMPSPILVSSPLPSPVLIQSPLPSPVPLSSPVAESHSQTFAPVDTPSTSQEFVAQKAKNSSGKRRRHEVLEDDGLSEAVGAFKKLCEARVEKLREDDLDPLQGFGQMIVATIRSMEPVKQARAMQKVTAVVMEIKLERE